MKNWDKKLIQKKKSFALAAHYGSVVPWLVDPASFWHMFRWHIIVGMCNRGNVNFYAEIRKRGVGAREEKKREGEYEENELKETKVPQSLLRIHP